MFNHAEQARMAIGDVVRYAINTEERMFYNTRATDEQLAAKVAEFVHVWGPVPGAFQELSRHLANTGRVVAAPQPRPAKPAPTKKAPPLPGCPTPEKQVYVTKGGARRGANAATARYPQQPVKGSYRCACGAYHITTLRSAS